MTKYHRRCAWRWLPRRLHMARHLRRNPFTIPAGVVRYVCPPCTMTKAEMADAQATIAAHPEWTP